MSRRRKRRVKVGAAATFGGVILLIAGIASFDRFARNLPLKIRELQISGQSALGAPQVKQLSGIQEGEPMFGKFAARALASLQENPRVRDVTVVRSMTGKVAIEVQERKPAALASFKELRYVATDGTLMEAARTDDSKALDLPVLTGPWNGRNAKDNQWQGKLAEGTEVLRSLAKGGVSEKEVSELNWDERVGWSLYRVGIPTRIVLGTDGFEQKLERLRRVLSDFSKREAMLREIDLDFKDRVVVKLKKVS